MINFKSVDFYIVLISFKFYCVGFARIYIKNFYRIIFEFIALA